MPTRFIGKTACIRAYVYARQAARLWGSLAGVPLWVRPIVNRPTAALAPDSGDSQPPRLPVAGPIAPPRWSCPPAWRQGRVFPRQAIRNQNRDQAVRFFIRAIDRIIPEVHNRHFFD